VPRIGRPMTGNGSSSVGSSDDEIAMRRLDAPDGMSCAAAENGTAADSSLDVTDGKAIESRRIDDPRADVESRGNGRPEDQSAEPFRVTSGELLAERSMADQVAADPILSADFGQDQVEPDFVAAASGTEVLRLSNDACTDWSGECARELGRQLQRRRRARRLSIDDFADLLPVSVPAVRSYEQAGRSMSVVRLYEVCAVLRERPSVVLAAVESRVLGRQGALWVDLVTLARSRHPSLLPASAWARARRSAARRGPRTVVMSAHALVQLAIVCGVRRDDLLVALYSERAVSPAAL
jgi:transcriptional regulator with XRE-family HTH domain